MKKKERKKERKQKRNEKKNTSWWQILHFTGPETGRHNEDPPETKPTYSIHS